MDANGFSPDGDDLLTTREAARLLRVSPETVIRWILHDGLAHVRRRTRGGRYRYLVSRAACIARLERPRGATPVAMPTGQFAAEVLGRLGLLKYVGMARRAAEERRGPA